MKSGPGDSVILHAPGATEHLQILEVRDERIAVKPFIEPGRGASFVIFLADLAMAHYLSRP